jgi:hypothetical protein
MSVIIDGTNGISDVDGSAATPAIRGSDTNTGIFFPAADTIAFAEGGVESMRLDSAGNVGIGTSSPSRKLHLSASGADCGIRIDNTVSGRPTLLLYDNSQNLELINSSDTGYFAYRNGTGAGSERMRIDSSGNLLVGTTGVVAGVSGAGKGVELNEAGYIATKRNLTAQAGQISFNNPNGQVGLISTTGSSTAYATSSDYRLKHDTQPLTGALSKVAQLKPVTYKWNADDSQSQGFIAHELQEVVPECVTGEKDAVDAEGKPVYQGIDTSFLVATLTAAIKEQQAIITALTARVEALEGAQTNE